MEKTMKKSAVALGILLSGLLAGSAVAEDINVIFKKVNDLITAQNYSKALEELKWASKEIEKMHTKKLEQFFPETIAGFTGEKINASSAMGISNLERSYKGPNGRVKVALTNLGGAGGGLAGLAQLGQMAALMGGTGMESFRIQGRTAMLDTTGSEPKLNITLDSGSMLSFDPEGTSIKADDLKAMAEAMKLDDLDKYLKGM